MRYVVPELNYGVRVLLISSAESLAPSSEASQRFFLFPQNHGDSTHLCADADCQL